MFVQVQGGMWCDVCELCCVWIIYHFKLLFAGNECCERLAYYGMSTNLVLYFKKRLHQHSAIASKNVSNWSGTCYITPLVGAFLADSYLGRYWTIAVFSIIYAIVSMVSSICLWLQTSCWKRDMDLEFIEWALKLGFCWKFVYDHFEI